MSKDQCDRALDREIALNSLCQDITDSMDLLRKIQGDFKGMSEALWPLIFTTILGEVRTIRRTEETDFGKFRSFTSALSDIIKDQKEKETGA